MIRAAAPLALLFFLGAAAPAPQGGGVSALRGHDSDAPIDISSDRLEVQDQADRAIWVGNVHAIQGDMTMDAARMTVAYRKADTPGADPQIQRIDASGNVVVVSPTERARGNFGIYDLDRKLITLIGGVTLTRDTNTLNGGRLVIDLNSGKATMDNRAVGGAAAPGSPAGAAGATGGRVTGHFTVPKRTTTTPAAPPAGTPPSNGTAPPK